ncbi:MAG: Gfo/Idh/MocA family oxidoreductase [Hungatella sp.]|nr:Gfo/Idh/MocA family oxidoreductase [Hungatella sp.]
MNFAIIGCGVIAQTHARALRLLEKEGCRLYALCDIVPEKADALGREYGAERIYYEDEEVFADPKVDVVCVCVPSGTHGQICIEAARAGKHIVCEKPMEITPEKMEAVTKAVRESGVKMQCIFQRRLMPAAAAVRKAVAEGKLGKLCMAEARLNYYRDQAYYDSAGWRGTWDQDGGGALMNQGVHGIDLILWMLGEKVQTIYGCAQTLARKIPVEDTAAAVLRMESGCLCAIQGSTTAYPGYSSTFSIYGEKGAVSFNDEGILEWNFLEPENAPPRPDGVLKVGGSKSNVDITIDGHVMLLRDLKEAVEEDRQPMIPPEDGQRAVKVICGIYKSSSTGAPVGDRI